MDFFNEYIVRKQPDSKDMMKIGGTLAAGTVLIMVAVLFAGYLGSLFLLLVAGIIYGMYFLISSQSVEFEYIVTNGELDIDKIISRRRRKRLVSVNSKNFEYFAPYNEEHKAIADNPDITKKIAAGSSMKSPKLYYAIYHRENEKTCLFFEPTEKMVKEFSLRVPRSVFFS